MAKHKLTMFLYYFVYISIIFFLSPFLVDKGLEQTTVGYLTSFSIVLLVLSLFLNGYFADKITSNKNVIINNLAISAIFLGSLIFSTNEAVLMISYVVVFATYMMVPAMIDGLVLKDIDDKNVPPVRAYGSIGAAIGYFVNSYLIAGVGLEALLLVDIAFIIAIIFIVYSIKEVKTKKAKVYASAYKNLFKDETLKLIIIISFLTYGVLAADDVYAYAYSVDFVGISPAVNGIIGFISIALEAVLILMFFKIAKNIAPKKVLLICATTLAIIFFTRSTLYTIPFVINAGNILIGVFTGLFIPLILLLIDHHAHEDIKNSMLSLYLISVKLGGAVIGFITTFIYSMTGQFQSIYWLHFAVVIFAIFFIATMKTDAKIQIED